MIRDFVTGVLLGGVVAGAGLGVASQMAPLERLDMASTAVPAQDAAESAALPLAEAPAVQVPAALETAAAAGSPDLDPTPPAIEQTEGVSQPEAALADAPGDALLRPAPVEGQPAPATIAPQMPMAAEEGETPPTADAAPLIELAQVETPAAPSVDPDQADAAQMAVTPTEPAADAAIVLAPTNDAVLPNATPQAETDPVAQNALETMPADPAPAELAPAEPLPTDPAPPDPALPDLPDAAMEPNAQTKMLTESTLPTLVPDGGLNGKQVNGVTTGRLPSIGAADGVGTPAPNSLATDQPAQANDLPPIQRFARPFENPSAKPLFAVLLLDPGTPEVNRADLAALPFPVTFVIDPMAANAAEAAAIYRAGGQEVVMLATGIPKGAKATDLEQSFARLTETLPEAVALIDTAQATFQDNRSLATEVVTLLADQGRGVVTYDRGLNAADQAARREELPAATVFRSLDDDGEDAPLIRRYLDRAAFKAAQEGRVVVIGTARPDTIAALMEWAIEGRSASVALAPISAVMAAE